MMVWTLVLFLTMNGVQYWTPMRPYSTSTECQQALTQDVFPRPNERFDCLDAATVAALPPDKKR